jgi:hypothetical protein
MKISGFTVIPLINILLTFRRKLFYTFLAKLYMCKAILKIKNQINETEERKYINE